MTTSTELILFPDSVNLPSPAEFKAQLLARLEGHIIERRAARGDVLSEADVYGLARDLQRYKETAGDYARALTGAASVAGQEQQEELLAVPGKEQDGVPTGGMTVPDLDGTDIKFTLNNTNEHTIDADAVYPAIAAVVMAETDLRNGVMQLAMLTLVDVEATAEAEARLVDLLATALIAAQEHVVSVGSFSLQVTKVKALAKTLAAKGEDALAATVLAAIKTKKVFKGLVIKREERK